MAFPLSSATGSHALSSTLLSPAPLSPRLTSHVRCSLARAPLQGPAFPASPASVASLRGSSSAAAPPSQPLTAVREEVLDVASAAAFQREVEKSKAEGRLLIVEFTKQSLPNAEKTKGTLLGLADMTSDLSFLRVPVDVSPELRDLCGEHDVTQIPCYVFLRNGVPVHKDTGMNEARLREEVLYYGRTEYPVRQLESREDVAALLQDPTLLDKLVVVQVTLNFCGPCVRVYPAVLQMSHKMAGTVVFARLFGDSTASATDFLTSLGIVEAPTFLFYRNSTLLGRYVGSGKGELIGEVLRYQGVECT